MCCWSRFPLQPFNAWLLCAPHVALNSIPVASQLASGCVLQTSQPSRFDGGRCALDLGLLLPDRLDYGSARVFTSFATCSLSDARAPFSSSSCVFWVHLCQYTTSLELAWSRSRPEPLGKSLPLQQVAKGYCAQDLRPDRNTVLLLKGAHSAPFDQRMRTVTAAAGSL